MKNKRAALLLAAAAIAGLIVFIALIPGYSLFYSIDSKLDRGQAIKMSREIAEKIGEKLPDNLSQNTTFRTDAVSLGYLNSEVGIPETNTLVRTDSIPLNFWDVTWFDASEQSTPGTKLEVQISAGGRLSRFTRHIPDTAAGPSLQEPEALTVFHDFWTSHGLSALMGVDPSSWKMRSSEPIKLDHRQDWSLTLVKDSVAFTGLKEELKVRLYGDQIVSANLSFYPPDQFTTAYTARGSPFIFLTFSSWIVIFVLFAIGLVLFLKRYNEGEAGIGSALLVAGTYYVAALIAVLLSFPSVGTGVMIGDMNTFYKNLVMGAAFILLWFPLYAILTFSSWGIGESSARAIWPEKLFTFDAASHFRLFNDRFGASTLRGYAFGGILLGIYAAAHPLLHVSSTVASVGGTATMLDSYVPSVATLANSFAIALFCETFYRFGLLSYFGKSKLVKGIAVSAILFIPSMFYPLPYGDYSVLQHTLIAVALSAALIFLFLRYDFVTTLVASTIFCSAQGLIPIFNSSNSYMATNSVISAVILLLPIAVSLAALWRKQQFELTVDLMPVHIRRISERERMSRELEIAKNVQNNLLPKSTPSVPSLEFGGICIPALEVGGDYYDFVQMQSGLIGTAIADVSGKGLPAAIYMTLTKGALLGSAEDQPSPRKVLSKINQIVYRSISRGTFISMIYAVIDTKTNRVKFSRAGHNPLALFSSDSTSAKLFTPNGLALGLDDGDKFDATLEEMEITLKPGDALVFYTDGFTEAMDSEANEFGEERLVELIEATRQLPVKQMIEKIDAGVRKFVGVAPQHDDMTMVVIKVKQE